MLRRLVGQLRRARHVRPSSERLRLSVMSPPTAKPRRPSVSRSGTSRRFEVLHANPHRRPRAEIIFAVGNPREDLAAAGWRVNHDAFRFARRGSSPLKEQRRSANRRSTGASF